MIFKYSAKCHAQRRTCSKTITAHGFRKILFVGMLITYYHLLNVSLKRKTNTQPVYHYTAYDNRKEEDPIFNKVLVDDKSDLFHVMFTGPGFPLANIAVLSSGPGIIMPP